MMKDIERKIVNLEERLNAKNQFPQPGMTYVVEFTTEEELQEKVKRMCDKYGPKATEHILAVERIEKPKNAGT